MIYAPHLPDLRKQLELAQFLAKSHIGFVVVPALTDAEYNAALAEQACRLEKLAQAAEAGQNGGCDGG